MSKTLFVGDLHVMVTNLEDTANIFALMRVTLRGDNFIGRVILTGDILHTHDIVRQSIAHFVKDELVALMAEYPNVEFVVATGNHCLVGPTNTKYNANRLMFAGTRMIVVDHSNMPYLTGPYAILPFIPDNEQFIDLANGIDSNKVLVCHQTFDGAKYENGFYAPGGLDISKVQQKIISGHIHTHMEINGQVLYVGSPRAITWSEANQSKFLMVIQDDDWTLRQKIVTDDVVKCYKLVEVREDAADGTRLEIPATGKDDVRVRITGSQGFYDQIIEANKELIGKVKFIPNIEHVTQKRLDVDVATESVGVALKTYVFDVSPTKDKDQVWQKIQTLIPNL